MGRPSGFGDAEAKRILERAAELDAQDKRLDATALREIAAEAGISPTSVDRALEELAAPPAPARRKPWLLRHPGLVIGGGLLVLFWLMRLFP